MLNVDRQPERWEQASERFGRFGVAPVRWSGVDAGAFAGQWRACQVLIRQPVRYGESCL